MAAATAYKRPEPRLRFRRIAVHTTPSVPKKRHSFRPLLFAPPQGREALPPTVPPPPPVPAPAPKLRKSANDSHVRLRALAPLGPRAAEITLLEAQDVLDELCEDQLTMSMNLACLEESMGQIPRDPSARAAFRTLDARIADLGALRDALANVHLATVDVRLQRVVMPDAPLAEYIRGIYAWAHAVLRALDNLSSSLRRLEPDWALLRWRLEEAKNFHFDELHDAIRNELVALRIVANGGSFGADLPPLDELEYAVERLFSTAVSVEEHLDERFG